MRIVLAAAIALAACGGGEKKVEGPDSVDDADDGDEGMDEGEMVSQEVLDGIKRVFERKVTVVGRCWEKAVDAGDLQKNDKVILTVNTTIQPSGSPTDTTIIKSSAASETLKSCVVNMVSSWTFPQPPKSLPFSHIYRFEEF